MSDVRTPHTADVDPATLAAARALLDAVFEGEVSDHAWDHALGGAHALVWGGNDVGGRAAVVKLGQMHAG